MIDYYNFITDGNKLRRYLFDSNVRDFMGLNRVNEDIRNTLLNEGSPDFWWLNNGITILATKAIIVSKSIQIQDIQIVNGLQTSESIFRHFGNGGIDSRNRSVLVKVIVSNNAANRDEIIRATNNQTSVELSALHATDKIQRDIEDVLKLNDYFYERRTNYYKNQGIPPERILTPLYLASGFVSLILKSPEQATSLKSKFMRVEESYTKIFSEKTNLNVWPKIAIIMKLTDHFLESKRPNANSSSENFLKNRRQYLMFLTLSRLFNSFTFSINDIVNFDISKFSKEELKISWNAIKIYLLSIYDKSKFKQQAFLNLCKHVSKEYQINGLQSLIKEDVKQKIRGAERRKQPTKQITPEFVQQVNMLLPKQPWKPGIHKEVAIKLNCTYTEIYEATNILINNGERYRQKDGILYNLNNEVVGFDSDRVDQTTLDLL